MSFLGIIVAGLAVAGLATVVLINRKVRGLAAGQDKTMGQLEDLANAFDAETTAVGIELDDLRNQLQTASVSGQSPDPATISRLQNIADRLKAMTGTTVRAGLVGGVNPNFGSAPTAPVMSPPAVSPGPQPTTTQTPSTTVATADLPSAAPNGSSVGPNAAPSALPGAPAPLPAAKATPSTVPTAPDTTTKLGK